MVSMQTCTYRHAPACAVTCNQQATNLRLHVNGTAVVQGLEQSVAVMRLGLKLAFNPRRCSLHFQLNAANPEHAEVAKKLVDMAQKVQC